MISVVHIAGDNIGSPIQAGSPGAHQSVSIGVLDLDRVREIVAELEARAPSLELSEHDAAQMQADLATVGGMSPVEDELETRVSRKLSEIIRDEGAARALLEDVGLATSRQHPWISPEIFWTETLRDLENGITTGGVADLVRAVAERYPGSLQFGDLLREIDGDLEHSGEPTQPRQSRTGEVTSYSTFILIGSDRHDEFLRLVRLLADPQAELSYVSTEEVAVLIHDPGGHTAEVRQQLIAAVQGWGDNVDVVFRTYSFRPYLLHHLVVHGPDGNAYELRNVPNTTPVSDIALAVLQNYGDDPVQDRPGSIVRPIVDRLGADGTAERLRAEETVHEAGVEDGAELRVGVEARAGGSQYNRLLAPDRPLSESYVQVFTQLPPILPTLTRGGEKRSASPASADQLKLLRQETKLERERLRLDRVRVRLRREQLKVEQEELLLKELRQRLSGPSGTAGRREGRSIGELRTAGPEVAEDLPPTGSIHTVVYADVDEDTEAWRRLSAANSALAESLGYVLERELPTQYGSVFQRAFWKRVATSDEARHYEATLQQALGLKVATLNQAEVDSKQAAAAATLIGVLAPISTACVKVGSVLVLKYTPTPGGDPVVLARTLSAREVQAIDRYPAILNRLSPELAHDHGLSVAESL